jgi:chromosome segregation ATPase
LLAIADELEERGQADLAERLRELVPPPGMWGPGQGLGPGSSTGRPEFDGAMRLAAERDTLGALARHFLQAQGRLTEFGEMKRNAEALAERLRAAEESGRVSAEDVEKWRGELRERQQRLAKFRSEAAEHFRESAPAVRTRIDAWLARLDQEESTAPEAVERRERLRSRLQTARGVLERLPEDDVELLEQFAMRGRMLTQELREQLAGQQPQAAALRTERIAREMQALRERLERLERELETIEIGPELAPVTPPAPPRPRAGRPSVSEGRGQRQGEAGGQGPGGRRLPPLPDTP